MVNTLSCDTDMCHDTQLCDRERGVSAPIQQFSPNGYEKSVTPAGPTTRGGISFLSQTLALQERAVMSPSTTQAF